jgi:cystathionine beta-synthase/cysteine synthase A
MRYPSMIDTIGNTPLVQLKNICPNPLVTILLKLEFFNPSGSIKDRIVKYILEDAIKTGLLKPGGTIIEATSGNTGAAIAMIAAIYGYSAILVLPDKVSKEKQDALKAYGAKIVVTPTSAPLNSPDHYVNKAKQLAKDTPGSFQINQYDNLKNREAHYKTTGPEIWEQSGGAIDYFVASGSTGGTISGVSLFLKEKNPKIQTIMPDPIGSMYYEYFKTGKIPKESKCTYFVEGIGEDHLVKGIDFSVIDDVLQVTDKQSFATARLLARKEGILAGGSSGSNVFIALELAKRCTKKTTIVTIAPDGGIKYLSKLFNDSWMQEQNLL